MNQLKRIYNFNFVADLVMAEAISRFCFTCAVSSSTSRSPGPETMDCYNCDRPDEAARAGEAREGAGSRACASAATGRATSPWNVPSPPTAGPEAAAPSVAGWCKVELQTIHRFSQSRRRPLIGPSPG